MILFKNIVKIIILNEIMNYLRAINFKLILNEKRFTRRSSDRD